MATAANRSATAKAWTLERVFGLFPSLTYRQTHLGSQLSGGEQQMLAIGRALMTNPHLLILDEATEGLSPIVRAELWRTLHLLKESGLSILLIDKNVHALARVAGWNYIIEKGRIVWEGCSATLLRSPDVKRQYLGM